MYGKKLGKIQPNELVLIVFSCNGEKFLWFRNSTNDPEEFLPEQIHFELTEEFNSSQEHRAAWNRLVNTALKKSERFGLLDATLLHSLSQAKLPENELAIAS